MIVRHARSIASIEVHELRFAQRKNLNEEIFQQKFDKIVKYKIEKKKKEGRSEK